MAIVISGVNNNDKITASDGTIDLLSGVNYTGILTAPAFTATGNITAGHLNIGSGIQLGNAGIITATTLVGNVTGNVNHTSNLLLQISGSEKLRIANSGAFGLNGTNYGTSGQVLTSQGSGSSPTWTSISVPPATTINNNANNRVITGSGTANTLEGEANLTFDGSGQLGISHTDPKIALVDTTNNTDAYIFSDDNGSLRFQADQNSEASDTRIRFQTDGTERVSIDNNLTILNGNLVIGTNNKGIDFSATANASVMNEGFSTTAPTMDNELLKTYERGTWTGNIRGYDHAGGAGWGNVATTAGTNSATGRYIRIGNLVTCFIKFSGITWDTSWTYFSIIGVPFGHNHYDGAGGFCLAQDTNSFTNTGMTVMGNVHGSQGLLVGQQPNGTTNLTLDTSNSNRIITASMVFYTSTGG